MANKKMFLPFYYSRRAGLKLLSVKTFGYPMRYFNGSSSDALGPFWHSTQFGHNYSVAVKTAGEVVVAEREAWDVEYCMIEVFRDFYMSDRYEAHCISSLDDIMNLEMPAEMRLGLLQVINAELLAQESMGESSPSSATSASTSSSFAVLGLSS